MFPIRSLTPQHATGNALAAGFNGRPVTDLYRLAPCLDRREDIQREKFRGGDLPVVEGNVLVRGAGHRRNEFSPASCYITLYQTESQNVGVGSPFLETPVDNNHAGRQPAGEVGPLIIGNNIDHSNLNPA